MFFEGSLQEGISTALQQSRQVVCFVTDGGSESQQWENEFLKDEAIRPGLESQSVVLRLSAGSEEAGYLEALFPVPKKPTIVVIQNGQLKEYIASGTSKEEFIRRLSKTTQPGVTQSQPSSSSAPRTTAANHPPAQHSAPARSNDGLYDDIQLTAAQASSSAHAQGAGPTPTEEEQRPKAEKKDKGKGRAEAEDEARRRVDERCGCEPTNPEQAHANEVKLRKQQANEERKRILKRIEDDKRARKEREAAERRARTLLSATPNAEAEAEAEPPIPLRQRAPKAGSHSEHCNLQVRLLDGATLRTRFASDATLGGDVRRWLDTERTDGDAPYGFRVVLAPRPNRALEPHEELKSLLSLGLAPSATLVLVPARYSVAYARAGVLAPVIGAFSSLCGAIMASIGGFFALFFGGGGGNAHSGHQDVPMENLRARRDAQLYNGNSLNFEPRNEEDDEQDTR